MEEGWREFRCSSGVTLLYGPFPSGMYWDVMARALEEHPIPEPPQKTIEVLGGTEEVDDPDDPEYQKELNAAYLAQWKLLSQVALDLCTQIKGGLEPWEPVIRRIAENYVKDPPPDDPEERRVWFINKYALRTPQDRRIVNKIQRFSQIEDEEVRQRAEFFRGDVAGAEDHGADAPGAADG